jgi:hypothetical protein
MDAEWGWRYIGVWLCVRYGESTVIISLKNFNQFLFVMENQYLSCDVGLHYLNIIEMNFMF